MWELFEQGVEGAVFLSACVGEDEKFIVIYQFDDDEKE